MAEHSQTAPTHDFQLRQVWKAGDTLLAYTELNVEGMIAGTKWVQENLMVILVLPPYTSKEGTTEKANILFRTPTACSRSKLDVYDYAFPKDAHIRDAIIKAQGNHYSLQEVVSLLNQPPLFLPLTPASLAQDCPVGDFTSSSSSQALPEKPSTLPVEISDQVSVRLALSQTQTSPPRLPDHLQDEYVLNHLARELSQRLTFTRPPSTSHDPNYSPLDVPHTSLRSPPRPAPLRPLPSSTSSSTTSKRSGSLPSSTSSSRSSSSSRSPKVRARRKKHSSGVFTCPFTAADTRQVTRPLTKVHSKSEERKFLRYALHDLYNEYSTLKNFVDSLRSSIANSPTKPYTSDLIWLQHHANYLDAVLLYMSTGAWAAWNEIIVDKLTRAFLELVVRVSPQRKYPDILEEPVRKWMRKKRVGIASQFGPVPSFLSQAKVMDSGIEPKNGWDSGRPRETPPHYGGSSSAKTKSSSATFGDKK